MEHVRANVPEVRAEYALILGPMEMSHRDLKTRVGRSSDPTEGTIPAREGIPTEVLHENGASVWSQDASRLRKRTTNVHVLQDAVRERAIERIISKRKVRGIRLDELEIRISPCRDAKGAGVDVDPDGLRRQRPECLSVLALPATDVEDPRARPYAAQHLVKHGRNAGLEEEVEHSRAARRASAQESLHGFRHKPHLSRAANSLMRRNSPPRIPRSLSSIRSLVAW